MKGCALPEQYDVVVVGAGSGGIGAALAASRMGLATLLVEKADGLGGTAARGGVSMWEPGVGGTGIPFDIYRRLKKIPGAVGVYSFGRHGGWAKPGEVRFPGGEHVVDPSRRYADTLCRYGTGHLRDNEPARREMWHGVVFEPDAYARVVEQMLAETGRCTVMTGTRFVFVKANGGRIVSLHLSDGREVAARAYVDGAAGELAVACGCETMLGRESTDAFGEPAAPDRPNPAINGVTLIYRVTPIDAPAVEPLPGGVPEACWWAESFPGVSMVHFPCGDRNLNMLPTMEGLAFQRLGTRAAMIECRRRVRAHWHHFQTSYPEFRGFRISWIAPGLGVREGRRVVGEYVLTQHDLLTGLSGQRHADMIAIADHSMDRHGAGGGCGELDEPYGIPYRCLIPRGFRNLLVACRASSFSSIAASSCRLSRTMLALGQAAGTAAAVAKDLGVDLPDVPPDRLRDELRTRHVQLEFPLPPDLVNHLRREDDD